MDWIAISVLVAVIFYQGWQNWHIQKIHEGREKDLMNRIMSRNYETFVNAEIVKDQNAKRPDEIFEEQEEQGIAV